MFPSVALYAAADQQLTREIGEIRLTSVQARLAQCFYLLTQSRINRCWNLFSTTARLAIAAGLHRQTRQRSVPDHIVSECRKRVFWCAYSLDVYLSAALGRPRLFHDENIDQVCNKPSTYIFNIVLMVSKDYPTEVDDGDLFAYTIAQPLASSQRIMTAPICHAKY